MNNKQQDLTKSTTISKSIIPILLICSLLVSVTTIGGFLVGMKYKQRDNRDELGPQDSCSCDCDKQSENDQTELEPQDSTNNENNDTQEESNNENVDYVPQNLLAKDDICGTFVFKENLADDYESALSIYSEQMREENKAFCPDQPCLDIRIDQIKPKLVTDKDGNPVDIELWILTIIDIDTETAPIATHDAIDQFGNWYELNPKNCLD